MGAKGNYPLLLLFSVHFSTSLRKNVISFFSLFTLRAWTSSVEFHMREFLMLLLDHVGSEKVVYHKLNFLLNKFIFHTCFITPTSCKIK
jgi:hypothetical protein